MLKTALDWLVRSSRNPEKFSLTLKAGVPFLVLFFGWAGLKSVGAEEALNDSIEPLVGFIVLLVQVCSGAVALFGAARKVWLTVR